MPTRQKDLVILTEGKDDVETIKALLNQPQRLGIVPITFDIYAHPQSGPDCLNTAHDILSSSIYTNDYALVVFDRVGCGQDHKSRNDIETIVETNLRDRGWNERAKSVVIDPELEIWAWSASPHVESELGWKQGRDSMLSFLYEKEFWIEGADKPHLPKEAFDAVVRATRTSYSASIHSNLASKVSLRRCTDQSFVRFKTILQTWFGSL